MQNFQFANPTRIVFGRGQIAARDERVVEAAIEGTCAPGERRGINSVAVDEIHELNA